MNPQQTTGSVSTSDSDSRGGSAEDDIPWNRENGSSKQDLQGMKKSFRVRVDPHSTPGSGRGTETPMGRTGGRRRGYWLGRRGTGSAGEDRERKLTSSRICSGARICGRRRGCRTSRLDALAGVIPFATGDFRYRGRVPSIQVRKTISFGQKHAPNSRFLWVSTPPTLLGPDRRAHREGYGGPKLDEKSF